MRYLAALLLMAITSQGAFACGSSTNSIPWITDDLNYGDEAPASDCLPPIIVIGEDPGAFPAPPPRFAPGPGLGSGGGGGGIAQNVYTVPANLYHGQNHASCTSDANDREAFASEQVRQYQAVRLAQGAGVMRTGSIVTVTYEGGGTERWSIANPLFTDPLYPVPVPGSRHCPSG